MPATDHRKAGRAVKIGGLRKLANRLLTRVDQVGVFFASKGKRPDTQHAIFRL